MVKDSQSKGNRNRPDVRQTYPSRTTIREKQSGVDRVSLGGSLASNVHGRGLKSPPFVADVESFTLLTADGKLQACTRKENHELFSLAIGGYGLFGIIVDVTLRLVRRTKVQRVVEVIPIKDLPSDCRPGDRIRRTVLPHVRPLGNGIVACMSWTCIFFSTDSTPCSSVAPSLDDQQAIGLWTGLAQPITMPIDSH